MSPGFNVDVAQLPTTMRRLIRAVGVPATMSLLEARGGTRVYLGGQRGRRDRQLLMQLLGEKGEAAFRREFTPPAMSHARSASEVTLPKLDKIATQIRDAAIRADETHSLTQLALMFKLTSRQIQNIRKGLPTTRIPPGQGDLFAADGRQGSGTRLNGV
ncbi:MAG TPA: hypothetical protein VHE37_10800 [Nevskiaceae bacterium]|nr:hypothetical protein [Nevskiaceae bacterium]